MKRGNNFLNMSHAIYYSLLLVFILISSSVHAGTRYRMLINDGWEFIISSLEYCSQID